MFEIEKKFLLLNDDYYDSIKYSIEIKQCYINTNPVLRARAYDGRYFFTYKGKGLLKRTEIEIEINEVQFDELTKIAVHNVITKTRHIVPYNEYTLEIDEFDGLLKGLIMCEIEFQSEEAAENFIPPTFLGEEVTKYAAYQNSNLCKLLSIDEIRRN